MIAADKGYLSLVELLLDRGANVNLRDKDGKTALLIAREAGRKGNRASKAIEDLLKAHGAQE
jgi:ankyrin repeat protein